MVVPSGENHPPKDDPVFPQEAPDIVPESKLLFEDSVAAQNTFRAHDNSIPTAITSLAKNGISPPLSLFLPASLERIRSVNVKTMKHGTGETTKVTVIDVTDFPDEATMSQATWCTTYNTFLTFIEMISGKLIFQGFATHYNHILSDPDINDWFPAYKDFDRKIRARFFTAPYIINVGDPEYRTALQDAKNRFLKAGGNRISASQSFSSGSSSRGGGNHSSRERSDRPKPYDRDQGTAKTHRLCFRCGRQGHGAPHCTEADPSRHGRSFVIYANKEGLFRIIDNHPVCTGFNAGRCDKAGQPNHKPIHICTLCGDAHHGAFDCTRN
ncbi:hypothetical protein C8J57DRAFT_1057540 [Mycena rebaudengoi]|nr:hypothetical protein C8J57DRAFT_1060785 [Mycena rebaudengoi]KAJ7280013.1 hypothetical protein C8J57DRAFT_1058527 [Mycena rebaudengoi]KAJ7281131.1 hypothetical protein C8J57DRAFT_1057540 [Mycena rebaudengoi]